MMPELGKYAGAVLSAYGVSLVLLLGLLVRTVLQGRAAKRALEHIEQETKRHGQD